MSTKLDKLREAFTTKTSSGDAAWKNFYPFWKMEPGQTAIIRFLPDADETNPLAFIDEVHSHELVVNGQRVKVPCLAQYNERCPICELSRKYYDAKDEENGKKYYRKKAYVAQVVVIESPIEHDQSQLVKLIEFGPAVFKQIQAGFQSGDLEEAPYEMKGGYNFRIKKTMNGQYASYSTSTFAPKQSDLSDELIAQIKLQRLVDRRPAKWDLPKVEATLAAALTGQPIKLDTPPAEEAEADEAQKDTSPILKKLAARGKA